MSDEMNFWLSTTLPCGLPHNIVLRYLPDDDEKAFLP